MSLNISYMNSLRCAYWNIHGYKSQIVGYKLYDPEFLETISDTDTVGLGEIQSEGEVSVSGFVCKKQKIRGTKFKGPKIAEGLGVFVTKDMEHLVQVVPNKNEDSIWIKLKKGYLMKRMISS